MVITTFPSSKIKHWVLDEFFNYDVQEGAMTPQQTAYNILRKRASSYLTNSKGSKYYAQAIVRALNCTDAEAVALQREQSEILAQRILNLPQQDYPADLG